MYVPSEVDTIICSPTFKKIGTLIFKPVSQTAFLDGFELSISSQSVKVKGTLSGRVIAGDGRTTYCADWETDADVRSIRMGPFDSDAVTVQRGNLIRTEKIGDHYFAYAEAEK